MTDEGYCGSIVLICYNWMLCMCWGAAGLCVVYLWFPVILLFVICAKFGVLFDCFMGFVVLIACFSWFEDYIDAGIVIF